MKELDIALYKAELLELVNAAIEKLKAEKVGFEIFTLCLCTDFNSCYSAVYIDSKEHSDKSLSQSRKWEEEQYLKCLEKGNLQQAELFKEQLDSYDNIIRETNPADFELCDFVSLENKSFAMNYEEENCEECWKLAAPILEEVAQFAYREVRESLNVHPQFEVAVNGEEDWYYPITPIEK